MNIFIYLCVLCIEKENKRQRITTNMKATKERAECGASHLSGRSTMKCKSNSPIIHLRVYALVPHTCDQQKWCRFVAQVYWVDTLSLVFYFELWIHLIELTHWMIGNENCCPYSLRHIKSTMIKLSHSSDKIWFHGNFIRTYISYISIYLFIFFSTSHTHTSHALPNCHSIPF